MGEHTGIAWCDATFNPWWGLWGPQGPRRFFDDEHWREPLRWNISSRKLGQRRRVFCGSMCDVFEDREDVAEPRSRLASLVDQTPFLDWLLLTKRPENVMRLWDRAATDWGEPGSLALPLRNIWMGITGEEQRFLDERHGHLAGIAALKSFWSLEPLLGPIDCERAWRNSRIPDWLIIGCERLPGNGAGRRCAFWWVRDLVAQARAAGVPVFVKQLAIEGRVSADPDDWPEDLRIQEFPLCASAPLRETPVPPEASA
jgi:protein gp37